ncbi:MAG: hypothetical protein Q9222_000274 [Ikaeria aurantiellina]
MPDIRSFFGGNGSQGVGSSQEKSGATTTSKAMKPKSRGKRKVLSDSDDEAVVQRKADSPVGEATTTSDYFAASGKAKPARSTPSKADKRFKESPKAISSTATPAKASVAQAEPPSGGRTSSRKKSKVDYSLDAASDDETHSSKPPIVPDDPESGEDIFGADYKHGRNGIQDDYESDEDDDPVLPTRNSKKNGYGRSGTSKNLSDDDLHRKDASPETPATKSNKGSKGAQPSRGRKRKSAELEEEDDDVEVSNKKPSNAKSKTPANKSTPKKQRAKKDQSPERAEVKEIFDSIPTVRPPTPPAKADREPKKFDFKAAGSRNQPVPAAGSVEIPSGAENCLAGLSFVFTGILDALGREEGLELVKRYGGKVTTAPSSKTSYVVLGNDAGPKKLETIQKFGLKTIDENGLFELIRRLPANGGGGKAAEKHDEKKAKEEQKARDLAREMEREEKEAAKAATAAEKAAAASRGASSKQSLHASSSPSIDSRLWTVKYAPTSTSMICGNKTQVDKLQAWLSAWPRNLKTKFKMPGKDGSGIYRAVIMYGPPGIGKTTAAHLAARLEGYDVVESNASDTRSKKLVETGLKGVLDTTSLLGYFAGDGKKVEAERKKLVLIMDEVDGMSAGDRGGVGALAAVCKKSHIPMILICNERKLPKMAPFDRVTYDLPFRRPTVDQIRSRIMTICFREKLNIPANVINALIEGSHADIRQIINMLSTAKLDQEAMDFDAGKKMSKSWEKHVILKPWDIVSKVLGGGLFAPSSKTSLNEKIELYFNDHEFSSLMLQENYLGTNPILSSQYSGKEKNLKLLELTDKAAESISDGDLVDRMIHGSQQQWSLMPTHAVFSFVRPASFVSGSQAGNQTRFTQWLGNNSKYGKFVRFIKEIQGHMRLRASGDRHQIRQEYLPLLWQKLVNYLNIKGKDGVPDVIPLMDSYFLTKDDWDAMVELGVGPMNENQVRLDTQTKATFTRLYNQQSHPLPFMKASSIVAPKKIKKDVPDLEEAIGSSDEGEVVASDDEVKAEDDEELDLKKDKYVKAPSAKKSQAKKDAAGKSGKGKGKGKGKDKGEEGSDEDDGAEATGGPGSKKGRGSGKTRRPLSCVNASSHQHTAEVEILGMNRSEGPPSPSFHRSGASLQTSADPIREMEKKHENGTSLIKEQGRNTSRSADISAKEVTVPPKRLRVTIEADMGQDDASYDSIVIRSLDAISTGHIAEHRRSPTTSHQPIDVGASHTGAQNIVDCDKDASHGSWPTASPTAWKPETGPTEVFLPPAEESSFGEPVKSMKTVPRLRRVGPLPITKGLGAAGAR